MQRAGGGGGGAAQYGRIAPPAFTRSCMHIQTKNTHKKKTNKTEKVETDGTSVSPRLKRTERPFRRGTYQLG